MKIKLRDWSIYCYYDKNRSNKSLNKFVSDWNLVVEK